MPDFSAAATAGVAVQQWDDPALGAIPSRINPDAERPHLRWVATVGVAVTITARVNGVSAPLDAALGGRLFTATMAESPIFTTITGAVGQSSVQTFTPPAAGHYTVVVRRANGGGVWMHIDAEDP